MPTLDHERHELRLVIVVLGGDSQRFIDALSLKDGELLLGEVHGFAPRLSFHRFSVDPWQSPEEAKSLEQLLPVLDGLILTDALTEGRHYSSAALERLVRSARPAHAVPVAVLGGPALIQEWVSLAAAEPVFVGEPDTANVTLAVKALLRVLLKTVSPTGKTAPPPSIR